MITFPAYIKARRVFFFRHLIFRSKPLYCGFYFRKEFFVIKLCQKTLFAGSTRFHLFYAKQNNTVLRDRKRGFSSVGLNIRKFPLVNLFRIVKRVVIVHPARKI